VIDCLRSCNNLDNFQACRTARKACVTLVDRHCRSAGEWLPCGMVPLGGKGVVRRRGRLDIPACIDPQAR